MEADLNFCSWAWADLNFNAEVTSLNLDSAEPEPVSQEYQVPDNQELVTAPDPPLNLKATVADSFYRFFLGLFNHFLYEKSSDKSLFLLSTSLLDVLLYLSNDEKVYTYVEEVSHRAAVLVIKNKLDAVSLNVLTPNGELVQQIVVKVGGSLSLPTLTQAPTDSGVELDSAKHMLDNINCGLKQVLVTLSAEETVIPHPLTQAGFFEIKIREVGDDSANMTSPDSSPHVFPIQVAVLAQQLFFNVYVVTYGPIMDLKRVSLRVLKLTLSTRAPLAIFSSNSDRSSVPLEGPPIANPKPYHDPIQLLRNLAPLLDPQTGGIACCEHVPIMLLLMTRFHARLVTKCMYLNILRSTAPHVLRLYFEHGGWDLIRKWTYDEWKKSNPKLVEEILMLLQTVQVTTSLLQLNDLQSLVEDLCGHTQPTVKALAIRISANWESVMAAEVEGGVGVTAADQDGDGRIEPETKSTCSGISEAESSKTSKEETEEEDFNNSDLIILNYD